MFKKSKVIAQTRHDLVAGTAGLSLNPDAVPPSDKESTRRLLPTPPTTVRPSALTSFIIEYPVVHAKPSLQMSPTPPHPSPTDANAGMQLCTVSSHSADSDPFLLTDPPPYSPTQSTISSSSPQKANKVSQRLQSCKTSVEDGRASSFAKAVYSGGKEAQTTLVKAEAGTHAMKTGNTPLMAVNVAVSLYRGGRTARKAYKGAELERVDRLIREGKAYVDEKGKVVFVGQEKGGECEEAGPGVESMEGKLTVVQVTEQVE
ncbi:hypothetical protein SLS60_003903 [Paraconiothyrium brasiliense]|uniref:Uncharacterized protein n=1 Tax=Paraconiothyrium brasiliense TaxID=300254 RepID=A0ABR3RQD5_9PLEO